MLEADRNLDRVVKIPLDNVEPDHRAHNVCAMPCSVSACPLGKEWRSRRGRQYHLSGCFALEPE